MRESLFLSVENVDMALAEAKERYAAVFHEAADLKMSGDVEAEVDGADVKLRLLGRFWHKRRVVFDIVSDYLSHRIPEIMDVLPVSEVNLEDDQKQAPDLNGDRFELERLGFEADDVVVIQHRPGLTFTGYRI